MPKHKILCNHCFHIVVYYRINKSYSTKYSSIERVLECFVVLKLRSIGQSVHCSLIPSSTLVSIIFPVKVYPFSFYLQRPNLITCHPPLKSEISISTNCCFSFQYLYITYLLQQCYNKLVLKKAKYKGGYAICVSTLVHVT